MNNYSRQWSTATPGYLIFLIDQSSSMGNEWSEGKTFSQFTAEVVNKTINELIATNAAGETVKDRVFISLIGYGGNSTVKDIRSDYLSTYAESPLRVEKTVKKVSDGEGSYFDMIIETPIFLEAESNGVTPMSKAFEVAEQLIESWVQKKNDNPVPVVINVTDGRPETGKVELNEEEVLRTITTANSIFGIETLDGNPLIFNVHISKKQQEIQFPVNRSDVGTDENAKILFQISSRVPEIYKKAAKDLMLGELKPGSKGLISNASPETLIKFINFGSSGGLFRANF
jgi:hypothetical protein